MLPVQGGKRPAPAMLLAFRVAAVEECSSMDCSRLLLCDGLPSCGSHVLGPNGSAWGTQAVQAVSAKFQAVSIFPSGMVVN